MPTPEKSEIATALEMPNPEPPGSIRARRLAEIEKVLTGAGWPEMSPRWRNVIDQVCWTMLMHIVGEVGRRGGKSSTVCGKWVACELTPELHKVPPGDVGYFAIISADKDQAQERLDTVHKALVALNVPHKKLANEILLTDHNLGVKCFAATTSAVVAFTCIGFLCDEMAMWRDKDSGANPARQIIEALRPTMATMPNAKGWYVSAVWSDETLHAEMVDAGTNDGQMVFQGTTPEFNPTLTDEKIRKLEPDEQTRMRAYYNKRLASGETSFFPSQFVDMARVMNFDGAAERTASGGDWAFRKNSSAVAVMSLVKENVRLEMNEERIPGAQPLKPTKTIKELTELAILHGADAIACDLHYIETARETTEELNLPLLEFPTDPDGIANAYVRFRVLLSEGRVDLSRASDRLIKQLKGTTQKPGDGATLKILQRKDLDGSHGDNVSALICAVWALDQDVPQKNIGIGKRRFGRSAADSVRKDLATSGKEYDYADQWDQD